MTLTKLLVPHKIPEWERPAMAPPPLGSSGSGDSDRSDNDDEKVAMECFYGLIREATRTCYGMRPCPPLLSISISLPTSIDDYIWSLHQIVFSSPYDHQAVVSATRIVWWMDLIWQNIDSQFLTTDSRIWPVCFSFSPILKARFQEIQKSDDFQNRESRIQLIVDFLFWILAVI